MRLHWHRFLTNPTARVLSVEGETVRLSIEGLVCDRVCAARTARALRRIDGVRTVSLDFDTGLAVVEGTPAERAVYQAALSGVALFKPLRRLTERVASLLGRSPEPLSPAGSRR